MACEYNLFYLNDKQWVTE